MNIIVEDQPSKQLVQVYIEIDERRCAGPACCYGPGTRYKAVNRDTMIVRTAAEAIAICRVYADEIKKDAERCQILQTTETSEEPWHYNETAR
jgi:hypothetical protein